MSSGVQATARRASSGPSSMLAGRPSGTARAVVAVPDGRAPERRHPQPFRETGDDLRARESPVRLEPAGELAEHQRPNAPEEARLGELHEHPVDRVAALAGVLNDEDAARRSQPPRRADQ